VYQLVGGCEQIAVEVEYLHLAECQRGAFDTCSLVRVQLRKHMHVSLLSVQDILLDHLWPLYTVVTYGVTLKPIWV